MAGLFSKGRTALSPAQQKLVDLANQQQEQFRKVWMPVQNYYAQQAEAALPALTTQAEGQNTATARAQGTEAQLGGLQANAARGAGVGSGASLMGLNRAGNATAAGAGLGATAGDLQARQAYEQGLAKVLQTGINDQYQAQGGLSTAAGIQSAEQGQQLQSQTQNQQAIGQLAGLAGVLGGPGPVKVPDGGVPNVDVSRWGTI